MQYDKMFVEQAKKSKRLIFLYYTRINISILTGLHVYCRVVNGGISWIQFQHEDMHIYLDNVLRQFYQTSIKSYKSIN